MPEIHSRPTLASAIQSLNEFFGADPLGAIRELESSLPKLSSQREALDGHLRHVGFSTDVVVAALELKRLSGQVNVLVHATGIVASLPYILEPDEQILSVSLGAGNTGKDFDLTTDRRVAEFKFIAWRGGPESIRQNQVFKDFLKLVWDDSGRRKQLYLTGTAEATRFLNGGRALGSVLSKDVALKQEFADRYGTTFARVGEFFKSVEGQVEVLDLRKIVPVFALRAIPQDSPTPEEL